MIYKLSTVNGDVYSNVPDDLNQSMVKKVFEKDGTWQIIEENSSPSDEEDVYDFAEMIDPSIFVHVEGDEYFNGDDYEKVEDGVMPDMNYFELIDKEFFDKMIGYWSKLNDYDVQELLDIIDDNKDYIADSAFIIDILE